MVPARTRWHCGRLTANIGLRDNSRARLSGAMIGDRNQDARNRMKQPRQGEPRPVTAVPRTVAIIDDNAAVLKGIERLLNAHGFATKGFSSAEAFLASQPATGIDCVLLDIHLGGMSGIALRRELSACGSTVPVIFMTAFDDQATRQQAQSAGCVAYLRKPFAGHLLIEAIAHAGSGR
jgi:CheY-like chemotaxis protein